MQKTIVKKSLQTYWRMTRALTIGAQCVVVDGEGRVLLIRHTYRPGWHFPGGGVEKNEAIVTAAEREVREEAGIIVEAPLELFAVYTNFRAFPSDHIALFTVPAWSQPEPPKPNREIAEHGFFPPDRLPETTVHAVRRRLAELRGDTPRSLEW